MLCKRQSLVVCSCKWYEMQTEEVPYAQAWCCHSRIMSGTSSAIISSCLALPAIPTNPSISPARIVVVDYCHRETGVTALMVAAGHGRLEVIEELLALGADPLLRSSNNWTALDWAQHFKQQAAADVLLAHLWVASVFFFVVLALGAVA